MAGVRPGGRLSARAKNRAGCACRRETSPRLRRRVLSSPLSVAVAWQERMNKPVVPELAEREQPEHLRQYFRERLDVHRQNSQQLPRANAPEYNKPGDEQQK